MRLFITVSLITTIACRTDKTITIQNPAPKADILSHDDGSVVLEGLPNLFIGTVTDLNHTPDQLTTIWYVNGVVVCDGVIPDENGETTCELSLGLEDTQITLAVQDLENSRGEDTIIVSIEPTESPEAQIVSPVASGVYYSDQLIEFEALVADNEDAVEDLSVRWVSTIDGELSNVTTIPNSSGEVIGFGNLSEGQHAIQLLVTDTSGKETQESVIIEVGPSNTVPLCEILTPSDGEVGTNGSVVTFTGMASDVDVEPGWLTVTWTSDKDGELGTSIPNSDGTIGFAYSDLTVDTHNITLTVTDEIGGTCTDSVFYTVGTPPSISINSPINGDLVSEGSPISFSATVSDAQDQPNNVSLEWVANGNVISTQGATSTGEALFTYGALSFGTYNVVVTATDTDGLTDSAQVNFTVNGLPTAPVVSINPNIPTTSSALNINIDTPSVDPEGVTPTYTYAWQLGGQTQTSYTSSSLPSSATSKGEQWTVVVTPNDGITDGVAGTASVVIGNTPPTVGSVTVTPLGAVYNDDILTCSASVSDPDETPTVSYAWTIGGSVVGSGSTLDLSTTGTIPGDTVVCTVIATDSDLDSGTNSGYQSVSNRSPAITASISTNGTNQNAELTCVGSATDPDGEAPTVTYEWFNGLNSLGSSNPLQLNATLASSGDVIDCIATATDAMGDADTVTVSHTVTNTAPVINSVTVTPDPATAGQDDLTCSVSASDSDGDALLYTYEWSNSTGVQQATTLVSDTTDVFLTSGLTEDTWTCEVTPYDGTDYGSSLSDSATVEDPCPVEGDGSAVDCPSMDCAKILGDGHANGDGLYWIDPELDGGAYEVYCLMDTSYDGGGWTLISTHSDDGQDTWTWNNRHYFNTDTTTFGSLSFLNEDFKSSALHDVGMQDLLFVHRPSGIWAAYGDVDQGDETFGTFMLEHQTPVSGFDNPGVSMSAGNLSAINSLNDTNLYFSVIDNDGTGGHSYGPTWNSTYNFSGQFDDPSNTSLGPCAAPNTTNIGPCQSIEWNTYYNGSYSGVFGVGYGYAVGANTGSPGTGQNYMQMFVRREYTDSDGDGYLSWEDCDDANSSVWNFGIGSPTCPATSCKTILDDGYSIGDGTYWLDPDGSGAFEVYCDMSTDGGGWTLMGKVYAGDYSTLSDQQYIDIIANPINDVNLQDLSNTSFSGFNTMAFLNRSKTNALYDSSTHGVVRIDVVQHDYASVNEGLFYQQLANKPSGIDFWAYLRNSSLWSSGTTLDGVGGVWITGLGQDYFIGRGAGGYNVTTETVVQNLPGGLSGYSAMGAWDFAYLSLNNGEILEVSRHFALINDAANNGYQWILTAQPADYRWKNEEYIMKSLLYIQ